MPIYPAPQRFRDEAHIHEARYEEMYERSVRDRDGFWSEQARAFLDWHSPFAEVCSHDFVNGHVRWFDGGTLNACANCIDRHLPERADQVAIIWEGDDPDTQKTITYRELSDEVCRLANALASRGVEKGDRVCIYMPMIPEVAYAMLACARIGAIHSVVFGGFSPQALKDRILDSDCRTLITADEGLRGGRAVPLKQNAETALADCPNVHTVLTVQRTGGDVPWREGRDVWYHELVDSQSSEFEPATMAAEDPLFILYTSGSTGKPKGVQHSTGGYLLHAAMTHKYVFDYHDGDIYWCTADVGWVTGHSYIVYGPLANAATGVLYEGVPTYPDPGRPWRIAERLDVNIFHTAPTTIRMLRKAGPDEPQKYNYHFKHMTTVGEPIEPEVWRWYYEEVGKKEAVVVDTYWQTETGGFLGATLPALQPMKPGSCGPGALGIVPVIFDEDRNEMEPGSGKAGNICITRPWPGMMQTVWGDPDRFVETYFRKFNTDPESKDWRDWPYFTGDGATQSEDGYYRIVGRVDDVINVAGHRLGTKELESAALTVEAVSEAAAVPAVDELRGRVPEMYISLKPGYEDSQAVVDEVKGAIATIIGPIARPAHVWISADLPKTRSGKIMRRVTAAISNFVDVGDTTTLANPEVVEEIRQAVQSAKVAAGQVPKDIPQAVIDEINRFGEES